MGFEPTIVEELCEYLISLYKGIDCGRKGEPFHAAMVSKFSKAAFMRVACGVPSTL